MISFSRDQKDFGNVWLENSRLKRRFGFLDEQLPAHHKRAIKGLGCRGAGENDLTFVW